MSKKTPAQNPKKRKTNQRRPETSTAVLSVRFSPSELGRVKQAAALKHTAAATFVRSAASKISIETINAMETPKQSHAIQQLADSIANHLAGEGAVCIERLVQMGDGNVAEAEEIVGEYKADPGTVVKPIHLDISTLQQLLMALQHATQPFADALHNAIKRIQTESEDGGFTPIITTDASAEEPT
jgi:hypothetical protein